MRQFGLLDRQGNGFRLSSLAILILSGTEGSDEQRTAVGEAVLMPGLFRDLHALLRGAPEETIRSYLVSRRRFTKRGAALAAAAYKQSVSLAESPGPEPLPAPHADVNEPALSPLIQKRDETLLTQTLMVSIPRNLRVDVSVHGDRIDRDDLEKIKNQLDRWVESVEEALD